MILWSKVVLEGKIGLVQFLIDCVLIRKYASEMIFIPKDNILIYFKVRQKILCCAHIRHISAHFKKFTIFAENRLFFPAKWACLKNWEYINVAPKNVLRANFIHKSKKFLYKKYWTPLGKKKNFHFLLG